MAQKPEPRYSGLLLKKSLWYSGFIMLEKIPFLHRQRMYNIVIEDDISFVALHHILDHLIENDAFLGEDPPAELYTVTFEKVCYTIGVDGIDVFVVISEGEAS